MNPYYIALWIMFVVAVVGMYAAFRWGYECACQWHIGLIHKGDLRVIMNAEHYDRAMKAINHGTRIRPVAMPSHAPVNAKDEP